MTSRMTSCGRRPIAPFRSRGESLLHRHIARALDAFVKRDGTLAADLAYHAALADDHETAARACVTAGERALRLFANVRGRRASPNGDCVMSSVWRTVRQSSNREVSCSSFCVLAAAGPGMRPLPPLIDTIAEATSAAESMAHQAVAATGHYLLSVLLSGSRRRAASREEYASRRRGRAHRRRHDAGAPAREYGPLPARTRNRDRPLARTDRARATASPIRSDWSCANCTGRMGCLPGGMVATGSAIASLTRALALARKDEDRWREYKCLTWLAMIEQELGRYADMQRPLR